MLLLGQRTGESQLPLLYKAALSTSQPQQGWHPTEGLVSQPSKRNLQGLCPGNLVTSQVANLSMF